MKFTITMNLPSFKNNLVQQVIAEHPAKSLAELCQILNSSDFIMMRQFYTGVSPSRTREWKDRGLIILNVDHIGKAQEFKLTDDELYESK